MEELIALSTRLVVMADHGRQMLPIYQAPLSKIDLIAHGIWMSRSSIPPIEDRFKVEGRTFAHLCFLRTRASSMCSMPYRRFWRSSLMWCTSCSEPPIPMKCDRIEKPTAEPEKFWPPRTNSKSTLSSRISSSIPKA